MTRPEYQHEVRIILKTDATTIQWGRIIQKLAVNGIPRIRQDIRCDPDPYLSDQLMHLLQTIGKCVETTGRKPIAFPPENAKR